MNEQPPKPNDGHIGGLIDLHRYSPNDSVFASDRPPDSIQVQGWFSIIYQGLTPRYKLKGVEITIVANILSLSRKSGWCYASEAALARLSGISVPTLEKHIKALHKRGVIESGTRTAKGVVRKRLSGEARDYLDYIRRRNRS